MGFLSKVSTVAAPARIRASTTGSGSDGWYAPDGWMLQLQNAGIAVTPELAMTLTAVYCAVTTIADDIATIPCHVYRYLDDRGDKERARSHPLSYLLRWQPNQWQTAVEFWRMMVGHFLLRGVAYAEIVPGQRGSVDQLIPRHPDRIEQVRLPNGRIQFIQREQSGGIRIITQAEMFVLRDLSGDGLNPFSRIRHGSRALGSAIAQELFTGAYFKKGATPGLLVTTKGQELDEEDHATLHADIARFVAGAENAGGVFIMEDDLDIKELGVDPKKAELLGLKDYSVREVARLFKMPGHKLEASQQTQAYAAREQANLEYGIGCLRPILVCIEQAIQRDLITAKDSYFAEFLMEALFRGDMKSRAEYFSKAIVNRWMWPSEVRSREGMNADAELDQLSKSDHRAGAARDGQGSGDGASARRIGASATLKATLVVHDAALRVLRREKDALKKLATKHASDGSKWQAELLTFYGQTHTPYVAETMRLTIAKAQAYTAQHQALVASKGVGVLEDTHWERCEAEDLTALALEPDNAAA
jgi:HK97 family phage portal protein